jgi:predicted site-specific integrase-resolvase
MVPLRKAMAMTGLTGNTLRKYADNGAIPSVRTPGGQRLFDIDAWLRRDCPPSVVAYCRVGSSRQRDALDGQAERMRKTYPEAEIVKDIGSSLSFKRPGLRALLERLLRGDRLRIVVTRHDRLAGAGLDAIRFLVEKNGGEILALDPPAAACAEADLAEVLALVREVFGRQNSALSPRQAIEKLRAMLDE